MAGVQYVQKGVGFMSTARISVNVDEDIKQGAQKVLAEMGLDLTTAIDSFLRTIVREERIPYELRTEKAFREAAHREYVRAELEKSIIEANNPDTVRLTHNEVMARMAKRREARQHE